MIKERLGLFIINEMTFMNSETMYSNEMRQQKFSE